MENNSLNLEGISFIEFTDNSKARLNCIFESLGFNEIRTHKKKNISVFKQNQIVFLLNSDRDGYAKVFREAHGPSICSMGWYFEDASKAYKQAIQNGARSADNSKKDLPFPAIYGIGDSLIYFLTLDKDCFEDDYVPNNSDINKGKQHFVSIDHLTNNLDKGTLGYWKEFYVNIFGFKEVGKFDIDGEKTGILSHALQSPCGTFCIPISEGKGEGSQIDEYLEEYNGAGIQHVALKTDNLLGTLDELDEHIVPRLKAKKDYYEKINTNIDYVKTNFEHIKKHNVLVDGNNTSYLLQLFSSTLIGPIFFEFIQRQNKSDFGAGNFKALFESIEQDQISRGKL